MLTAIDETCIMLETTQDQETTWLLGWPGRRGTDYHMLMSGDNTFKDFTDPRPPALWAAGICSMGAWREIPSSCPLATGPCGACDGPIYDEHYLCWNCR